MTTTVWILSTLAFVAGMLAHRWTFRAGFRHGYTRGYWDRRGGDEDVFGRQHWDDDERQTALKEAWTRYKSAR